MKKIKDIAEHIQFWVTSLIGNNTEMKLWVITAFMLFGVPAIIWLVVNWLFGIHLPYILWFFVINWLFFAVGFYNIKMK